MARVVRFCKLLESYVGDNVFDISRPHIFGNPFTHLKNTATKTVHVKSRDEAIRLYGEYFDAMVQRDETFRAEWDRMYEAYCKYEEIYLGCYCKLDEHCHADMIAKKLAARQSKEKIDAIMASRRQKKNENNTLANG